MPIQQGCTQAAPKKQHIVKTSATALNKSKKKKGFFFLDRSYALTNFVIVKSIGYNQKTYDFY
jgi:hypothetical protein